MATTFGCRIEGTKNDIKVSGRLTLLDLRRLVAALHNTTTKLGYRDVILDFRKCESAYPGPMAFLCVLAAKFRRRGISIALDLPAQGQLRNLFLNTGWAYLLNPENFGESRYKGFTHVPAVQYSSPTEQQNVVNRMMDIVLSSVDGIDREDLAAIEWSLNEITDNVLVHSKSASGGVVHVNNYRKDRRVEFVVADCGVGIPATLKEGHPSITSDVEALERAIREGVTRDKRIGQGNGLFGSFKIAEVSKGYFHVHSGFAKLDYERNELHVRGEQIPISGTLVIACLNYSNPKTLAEALRFDGKKHTPVDYVETHYESQNAEALLIRLIAEAPSFGSRVAGTPLRTKLSNLFKMNRGRQIVVDFSDIPLISSSFADEVFGKLFVELGPVNFMKAFAFRAVSSTVQGLLDRAIMQRSQSEP